MGGLKVLLKSIQLSTDGIVWNTLVLMCTPYDEIYNRLLWIWILLSIQFLRLHVPDIQPILTTIILLIQTFITFPWG